MEVDISQVKPEVTTPTPVKSKPIVNNSSRKKSSAKKVGVRRTLIGMISSDNISNKELPQFVYITM